MNILVSVDLSDDSQKILRFVKTLASGSYAKVWLLHVAEPEPDFVGWGHGPEFPQYDRDHVAHKFHKEHKVLQNEVDRLRNSGIDARPLLIQGPVVEVILRKSSELNIDLIVVGSHGHGAVYHLVVGSVSEGILKRSSRPVLVVPTHDVNSEPE